MPTPPRTQRTSLPEQRKKVLDNERKANQDEPRNFKEDALTDKRVEVVPGGTGPTPTRTFDAPEDRSLEGDRGKARKPTSRRG